MDDSNKKEFWAMINVCMELSNHPPLSKEAVLVWWAKLNKYEIEAVRAALDKWVDSTSKAPTPSDIMNLCKPVTPIYNAIQRKADVEANKRQAKKVHQFVEEKLEHKTDLKKWARDIVSGVRDPKTYPNYELSLKYAKEALSA